MLNRGDADRILIVEPSRFLVEQVHKYYQKHTNIPTRKLYGTTPAEERPARWDEGVAVVTTPQTAFNDLRFLEFDAVVVDECHHTTGEHAFAKLIRNYNFSFKLGLSATIPRKKEGEITKLVGEIRRWSWDHPDVKDYVPAWFGEVYDSPYPTEYRLIEGKLEEFRRRLDGTLLAGLPTLGIRMLCRDGASALQETLERPTVMGQLMGDEVLPFLEECAGLHKVEYCLKILEQHEFEKAVLFVDRVVVAQRLAGILEEYNPVLLLGRLRSSSREQRRAVEEARNPEARVIISTSAGEEGIDLPAADLLIVWSNVSNAVRWIQRQGRIMRKTKRSSRPKVATYIATPDSPDYESLRMGLAAASRVGVDIVGIDEKAILSGSIIHRVQNALEANPSRLGHLAEGLQQPQNRVDRWLKKNIQEGEVFYLYAVPHDLNEWRREIRGLAKMVKKGEEMELRIDTEKLSPRGRRLVNNLSPQKKHRYYCLEDDISVIETEFPYLVEGDGEHRLNSTFGSTWNKRGKYSAYGEPKYILEKMLNHLENEARFYANISFESYNPTYQFQMIYQGSATENIVSMVLRNADAIATELDRKLSE